MDLRDLTDRLRDLPRNKRALAITATLAVLLLIALAMGAHSLLSGGSSPADSAAIAANQELVEQLRPTEPPPAPSATDAPVVPGSGKRPTRMK